MARSLREKPSYKVLISRRPEIFPAIFHDEIASPIRPRYTSGTCRRLTRAASMARSPCSSALRTSPSGVRTMRYFGRRRYSKIRRGVIGTVRNVRFWHKADIPVVLSNVRFWGNSGHRLDARPCLLLTQSGHQRFCCTALRCACSMMC
jgi:hypothetical protein